ncbi:hypothetical protein L1887_58074 [Cichorium endivia]|nr:hypothetical protein L1887_58074 [Cichorium endivia]
MPGLAACSGKAGAWGGDGELGSSRAGFDRGPLSLRVHSPAPLARMRAAAVLHGAVELGEVGAGLAIDETRLEGHAGIFGRRLGSHSLTEDGSVCLSGTLARLRLCGESGHDGRLRGHACGRCRRGRARLGGD